MFQWPEQSLFVAVVKEYGVPPEHILPLIQRVKPCIYNVQHDSVFEFMMSIHFLIERLCTATERERIEVVERLEYEYGPAPEEEEVPELTILEKLQLAKKQRQLQLVEDNAADIVECLTDEEEEHSCNQSPEYQDALVGSREEVDIPEPSSFSAVEELIAVEDFTSVDLVQVPACTESVYLDEISKGSVDLEHDAHIQAWAVRDFLSHKHKSYSRRIVKSAYNRARLLNPSIPKLSSNRAKSDVQLRHRLKRRSAHMNYVHYGPKDVGAIESYYKRRSNQRVIDWIVHHGPIPPSFNPRAFKHLTTLYPTNQIGLCDSFTLKMNRFISVLN